MTSFSVTKTKQGTKRYPLHQHPNWEIMYYLKGEGVLATQAAPIPFKPGTIVIVPPKMIHGSVSGEEFVNISVRGDFGHLFMFDRIEVQKDNAEQNGFRLAELVYENRATDSEYLAALCNAFAHFLLKNATHEKRINREIRKVVEEITKQFFDPCLDVTALLNQSGYVEDYMRAEFKKAVSLSPVDFLTKIRIDHAKKLFEIYGENLSVSQVAEACGFEDPIYFSRRFRQTVGLSPSEYKRRIRF